MCQFFLWSPPLLLPRLLCNRAHHLRSTTPHHWLIYISWTQTSLQLCLKQFLRNLSLTPLSWCIRLLVKELGYILDHGSWSFISLMLECNILISLQITGIEWVITELFLNCLPSFYSDYWLGLLTVIWSTWSMVEYSGYTGHVLLHLHLLLPGYGLHWFDLTPTTVIHILCLNAVNC